MINKICSRCGRILPVGERCSCQPAYRRDYQKFRRDKKSRSFVTVQSGERCEKKL